MSICIHHIYIYIFLDCFTTFCYSCLRKSLVVVVLLAKRTKCTVLLRARAPRAANASKRERKSRANQVSEYYIDGGRLYIAHTFIFIFSH